MPPPATSPCLNPFTRLPVDIQLDVICFLSRWELYPVQLSSHSFDALISSYKRVLPRLRLDTVEFMRITDRGGELLVGSPEPHHDIADLFDFEGRVEEIEVRGNL